MTIPDFVAELLEEESRSHPGTAELRETHISWLIMTDDFVYKIKKPVSFGFLDFSDVEKRRWYCHEEVRLNRRLSPSVYLAVVRIDRRRGRAVWGEVDELPAPDASVGESPDDWVDFAVKMRRLPEERWLFHRLEDGTAGPADARRIADRIAAFHNALDPAPGPWGGEDTIRTNTEENFEQVRPFIGAGISAAEFDSVRAYTRSFLDQRRELFAARVRDGWIRDGHGDLHAAQICLENGISFIDCIEFSERFRIADVAADLAFLAMDLDRYGRPDLRRVLVDTYRRRTGDNGLLEVLDFYMAYRAFTRGKIECLRMDQLGPDEADLAEDDKARAAGYFALARRYAVPRPVLVVMSGLIATGKSTIAEAVADRLGAAWIRMDGVRKELAGLDPESPAEEAWGEGIYSPEFTRKTYAEAHRRAHDAIADGRCAILDGSYRKGFLRSEAAATAESADVPFLAVEVVCDDAEVRRRLARRAEEPHVSDGRLELLDTQRRRFEPLDELPKRCRMVIDGGGPLEEAIDQVMEGVYRRGLEGRREVSSA